MPLQLRLRIKLASLRAHCIGLHQLQQPRYFGVRFGIARQSRKLLVKQICQRRQIG